MAKLTSKNSKKDDKSRGNMKRKAYEAELRKLQVKLYHLQKWFKQKGLRVIIAFEGRDDAAVGGL
jgi:polyphosphate kinase